MSLARRIGIAILVLLLPQTASSQTEVISRVQKTVVKVSKSVWESDPISGIHRHDLGGSGVVVGVDRGTVYVLTNRHVADESYYLEAGRWCEVDRLEIDCVPEFVRQQTVVTFPDGSQSSAVLHWRSPCADLALLEATYQGHLARAAEIQSNTAVGEDVLALGHPRGLDYTLTKGIVSAKRIVQEAGCSYDAIQTDATINPGNSGGGLFNSRGYLVGINTWKLGEGLGFAVSIAHYLREIGQDAAKYTHGHEEGSEQVVGASGGQQPNEQALLWIGKFAITIELPNGTKQTFEASDALGIYSEADFTLARPMEVESRKEIIKQFILRKYGRDVSRVVSVELIGVEKQVFSSK